MDEAPGACAWRVRMARNSHIPFPSSIALAPAPRTMADGAATVAARSAVIIPTSDASVAQRGAPGHAVEEG
jgi:hypothetical protein